MRSSINAIANLDVVNERQDRSDVAGIYELRARGLALCLRLYTARALKHAPGIAFMPGGHQRAVHAVEPTMTAGSPRRWRPIPSAFASSR